MRGDKMIKCKCGCGEELNEFDKRGRKREYINGHTKRGKKISQETKDKIGLKNKKSGNDPKNIARIKKLAEDRKGKSLLPSHRLKISKSLKGKPTWNKGLTGIYNKELLEQKRESFSGENNPRWNGGPPYEKYDENYTEEFKEKIRKMDNYCCRLCGKHQDDFNRSLEVHHIDLDKKNTQEKNCISLCHSCHSKIHIISVDYMISFFKKIVDSRQEVIRFQCK